MRWRFLQYAKVAKPDEVLACEMEATELQDGRSEKGACHQTALKHCVPRHKGCSAISFRLFSKTLKV
jgi:hypothetical protein